MKIEHHIFDHRDDSTAQQLDSIRRKLARIELRITHLAEALLDDAKLAEANDKLAAAANALQAELNKQPEI